MVLSSHVFYISFCALINSAMVIRSIIKIQVENLVLLPFCYNIKDGLVPMIGAGRRTRLALWDDPADDITGVIARSEKVAGTFEKVGKQTDQ